MLIFAMILPCYAIFDAELRRAIDATAVFRRRLIAAAAFDVILLCHFHATYADVCYASLAIRADCT